jgi:hypothetical protein
MKCFYSSYGSYLCNNTEHFGMPKLNRTPIQTTYQTPIHTTEQVQIDRLTLNNNHVEYSKILNESYTSIQTKYEIFKDANKNYKNALNNEILKISSTNSEVISAKKVYNDVLQNYKNIPNGQVLLSNAKINLDNLINVSLNNILLQGTNISIYKDYHDALNNFNTAKINYLTEIKSHKKNLKFYLDNLQSLKNLGYEPENLLTFKPHIISNNLYL